MAEKWSQERKSEMPMWMTILCMRMLRVDRAISHAIHTQTHTCTSQNVTYLCIENRGKRTTLSHAQRQILSLSLSRSLYSLLTNTHTFIASFTIMRGLFHHSSPFALCQAILYYVLNIFHELGERQASYSICVRTKSSSIEQNSKHI